MSTPTPTSDAHITCLCGAVREPGTLLTGSTFPVTSEHCYCNYCRYTTGSLCVSCPDLKSAPSASSLSKLTVYDNSKRLREYFCSTCGTHIFASLIKDDTWFCYAGCVEQSPAAKKEGRPWPKNLTTIVRHDYVLYTGDGGIVPRLLEMRGKEIPVFKETVGVEGGEMTREELLDMHAKSMGLEAPGKDERLRAKCYCGGIDLLIKRADWENDTQGVPERHIPNDKTKYNAHFCACRYDRLASGTWVMHPWAYIPPANITVAATGKHVKFDSGAENEGLSLVQHWSSHDSIRSFCGVCGANVFYWCVDRPVLANVSVGLLRAEEGAMARRWLSWRWSRIAWKEFCQEEDILGAMLSEDE